MKKYSSNGDIYTFANLLARTSHKSFTVGLALFFLQGARWFRLLVLSVLIVFTTIAFAKVDSQGEKSGRGESSLMGESSLRGQGELMVYSSRKEHLVKPVFEAFERDTGIKIKYLTDQAASLIQKLEREGLKSPADIFMTVDVGNLYLAKQKKLFQPVSSKALDKNIPHFLKDPENHWFGFSKRARVLFYNPLKVNPEELSTYEDLASSKWLGRLCLRTSKKVYNQSLVATMIAHRGEKETEKVIKSWVKNLGAPIFSSDIRLLKGIGSGQCHVGIANTYYYGQLLKKEPNIPVKIFWPNQEGRGVHINISGAGLTKASRRVQKAKRFLEWLSEPSAQRLFVDGNMEYPVNSVVAPGPFLNSWGLFKSDKIDIIKAGIFQVQAIRLMDRAGYH